MGHTNKERIETRNYVMAKFEENGFKCVPNDCCTFFALKGVNPIYVKTTHIKNASDFKCNAYPANLEMNDNYFYAAVDYNDNSAPVYIYPSKVYCYESTKNHAACIQKGSHANYAIRQIARLAEYKNNFNVIK